MGTYKLKPNGKNRTGELVELLLHAPNGTTIEFEQGVYDFTEEGCHKDMFFPNGNRNGDKKVIFPLLNLKDITIDGGNSLFVFHDRVFPFIIRNCKNVKLKNFKIDFSFERCIEAVLGEQNEQGFLLEMDTEYMGCSVNEYKNLLIKAGKDIFSSAERRFFIEQKTYHCFIAVGDVYYQTKEAPAEFICCDAEYRENGIFFRYREGTPIPQFTVGKKLLLSYDELRENDVFFFDRCQNVSVENIHILKGAGMGFVCQLCENMEFKKCKIVPEDHKDYSTTADGMFFTNCSGSIWIDGCEFDRSVDDAMNIHGIYTKVDSITARNRAVVKFMYRSHDATNLYTNGDLVRITDAETMDYKGTAVIKESIMRDDTSLLYVEFEDDIAGVLNSGDLLENITRAPEVVIRNCSFMNLPSIRLSSSKKMVFENNVLKNTRSILVFDLMDYWYESGCVNEMLIKGNRFENMDTAICTGVQRAGKLKVKHKNITITENSFVNCLKAMEVSDVDGIVVTNNTICGVGDNMTLNNCENQVVQDNIIK